MNTQYLKAGYGNIFLAGIIDIVLAFVFIFFFGSPMLPLSSLVGLIIYRLICISLFSATLGMLVFNLVFLNSEQEPLNTKEKILAAIFVLFEGVGYYRKNRIA